MVVTARFPRLIRDKARTGQGRPLNTFARFPRVNAALPRFVSEYQTFRAFTSRLIFRRFFDRPTSRSHSLPFLEKRIRHLLATPFFREKETFENFFFHLFFFG